MRDELRETALVMSSQRVESNNNKLLLFIVSTPIPMRNLTAEMGMDSFFCAELFQR